jgi:hypothetical protein
MDGLVADGGEPLGQAPPMPHKEPSGLRRRWIWLVVAALFLVLSGVAVVVPLAATYQPTTWGCCEAGPLGEVRAVSLFAHYRADFYVPPQRGKVTFIVTIQNNGSWPVSIESVTIGQTYGLLRLAGPVKYARHAPNGRFMPPNPPVLHDVSLGPGHGIFVAISLRTSRCATISGWAELPSFFVNERLLLFTHRVPLPWDTQGGALIMRPNRLRTGGAGTFCATK